jgi:RhtB (resistance to homoserine/threonine) family protein
MIGVIAVLGVLSPGPDFFIVTKNSLSYSRKAGLYTALGVSLAILIHLAYCMIGIGVVISESVWLFHTIKYGGAAYLIYIGIQSLRTKKPAAKDVNLQPDKKDLSSWQALKMGFLTNALNPKATLFFLSVFSQVIDPGTTTLLEQMAYAWEIWIIALSWFCLLAWILTHRNLQSRITGLQYHFEKAMGCLLVAFGLKIALI